MHGAARTDTASVQALQVSLRAARAPFSNFRQMLWLDAVLIGAAVFAVLVWAALAAYILAVHPTRYRPRATLSSVLASLQSITDASAADRLAAVRQLLGGATRELVMHAASDPGLPQRAFETIVAVLIERWPLDSLVRDARGHVSARDRWRRVTALRILARSKHPQSVDLLGYAIADADVGVAAVGLTLLGQSDDPRAGDLLIDALASPTLSPARVAVYVDHSPQHLAPRLIALLRHMDPVVRQWAATLLGRYPDEPTESVLAELTCDPDPGVRKGAVQTLGRIGGIEAGECAIRLLADTAPYVRAHALRALGELGRSDQAEAVAALLGDTDWWVRLAARESLEMLGPEVWPVLVRCMDHGDKFVRNGAAEVVQNLGVLDNLIMLEGATDHPASAKVAMLQRIASAGGVRFTESLVERAGPVVGPRVRRLLDTMGLERVEAV